MVCTGCGATISDKAIVCYRCGQPTAIPDVVRASPPAVRMSSTRRWLLPLLLIVVAIALGWFATRQPEASVAHVASALAALLAGVAGLWLLLRRRR